MNLVFRAPVYGCVCVCLSTPSSSDYYREFFHPRSQFLSTLFSLDSGYSRYSVQFGVKLLILGLYRDSLKLAIEWNGNRMQQLKIEIYDAV